MESTTRYWLMEQIRNNLKEIRQERGLTQKESGLKMGKDQVFVNNCESGRRRIDPAELIMFADAYDVALSTLYDVDREEAKERDYKPGDF